MKLLKVSLLFITFLALCYCDIDNPEADVMEDVDDEAEKITKPDDDLQVESATPVKLKFSAPEVPKSSYFTLYFTAHSDLATQLTVSQAKKDGVAHEIEKYDGSWAVEVPPTSAIEEDFALVLKSKAKHHAVSTKLARPFDFGAAKQLVVQYEVKFENGQECGGAYVKLLQQDSSFQAKQFNDKSLYSIMFGPDKCGMDHKLHFIFQHKNPISGKFEEKHAKKPKGSLDKFFTDKKTHLYTLVVNADNTFEVFVDQDLVNSGSLLSDFEPPVNPPKEVDDVNDKKPEDWDERPKIADASAKKPEDWDETQPEFVEDEAAVKPDGWLDDEPVNIADPKAAKPADWDNDMDGEWEAPKIDNPKCKDAPGCGEWKRPKVKNPKFKGKWSAPMIDNPAYKGVWKPRRIPNPDYFEDDNPFTTLTSIGALGLELWSMSDSIVFDNFLITDKKEDADKFAEATWRLKMKAERQADPSAQSVVDAIKDLTNEKPWIWAVIVLVVILPIVLIIAYCCLKSDKSDDGSRAKKTDEVTPDDEDAAGDAEEEAAPAGDSKSEPAAAQKRGKRGGKSKLETAPAEEEEEEEDVQESFSEEEEEEEEERPAPSATKRRTRKD